tara:strand:+ start:293 stop:565 length:273 start_codon:yes stop_codon:yes gene_type:complete
MTAEPLIFDSMGDAMIGIAEQAGAKRLAVYKESLIIQVLMRENNWTEEDAWEWYEFNIASAYMGEGTPLIIKDDADEVTRVSDNSNLKDD